MSIRKKILNNLHVVIDFDGQKYRSPKESCGRSAFVIRYNKAPLVFLFVLLEVAVRRATHHNLTQ